MKSLIIKLSTSTTHFNKFNRKFMTPLKGKDKVLAKKSTREEARVESMNIHNIKTGPMISILNPKSKTLIAPQKIEIRLTLERFIMTIKSLKAGLTDPKHLILTFQTFRKQIEKQRQPKIPQRNQLTKTQLQGKSMPI